MSIRSHSTISTVIYRCSKLPLAKFSDQV